MKNSAILSLFFVFFFAGCQPSQNKIEDLQSALAMRQLKPAEGVLTGTGTIGTVDHPTLDGGIINCADSRTS